ncbi:MAG: hypothetical protein PGN09_01910 [Sphingomonas fennica]
MNIARLAAPALLAAGLIALPATAQTTTETKVSNDTNVGNDGVVTNTRKVTNVRKQKTGEPKKVLGVKVGEKTATQKTVHETTTDTAGNSKTKVTTSH